MRSSYIILNKKESGYISRIPLESGYRKPEYHHIEVKYSRINMINWFYEYNKFKTDYHGRCLYTNRKIAL